MTYLIETHIYIYNFVKTSKNLNYQINESNLNILKRQTGEVTTTLSDDVFNQYKCISLKRFRENSHCVPESSNNQKLMMEYEKYQELQAKSQKMQEDYERQLQEMEENKERSLEELTEYYETKLQEMTTRLEQVDNYCCLIFLSLTFTSSTLWSSWSIRFSSQENLDSNSLPPF